MITLFNQQYAVEQYGNAQKEEGRKEGRKESRIFEAVDIYRNELNLADESIIRKLINKFSLSYEEAEVYVSGRNKHFSAVG